MSSSILFGIAVLLFLCWKEFCSYLDRSKIADMAGKVTESATVDADVKQVEVEKLYALIEKVLSAQDEERERYHGQVSMMHDRIVSSLELLLNRAPVPPPAPERVDDFTEWRESMKQGLRDKGFGEEEAEDIIRQAEKGAFGTGDIAEMVRKQMVMKDLGDGHGPGAVGVAASVPPQGGA